MSRETRVEGTQKLIATVKHHHWSRGKTKDTCESLRLMGIHMSQSLKEAYKKGNITHWAKGKTANDDERIAIAAKKRSQSHKGHNHWHFMNVSTIQMRLRNALPEDKFTIMSGQEDIELNARENNVEHNVKFRCNACGLEDSLSIYNIIRYDGQRHCQHCDVTFNSRAQQEIAQFVESSIPGSLVLNNDRSNPTGYEFDVYVPSRNFAIEFNGLYWHSELVNDDKNYHQRKIERARAHDITLMHVFEDEWRDKRDIVESMIRTRLGVHRNRYYARKCDIIELDSKQSKEFFTKNHLDGHVNAKKTYALTFNDLPVAALSIRTPCSKRWKGSVEIARFATELNSVVVGGFSRLCKYVMKQFTNQNILCYVDRRWGSTGKHCFNAGLKLVSETTPTFWWTDCQSRFNRMKCKASRMQSERENANQRRWVRIYGCTNLVFSSVTCSARCP
jgi:hypothetical protein